MTKKDYILKALRLLQNDRAMAPGLYTLVQSNTLSPKVLDALLDILRTAITESQQANTQEKLQQVHSVVQTIKQQEAHDRQDEQTDLAELEQLFQNMS